MGINGGGETDDCMTGFDDCTTGTKGFCCSASDRRYKTVDSCVGVKPPDIAGSWVGVEDADDNESVCGVDADGEHTFRGRSSDRGRGCPYDHNGSGNS